MLPTYSMCTQQLQYHFSIGTSGQLLKIQPQVYIHVVHFNHVVYKFGVFIVVRNRNNNTLKIHKSIVLNRNDDIQEVHMLQLLGVSISGISCARVPVQIFGRVPGTRDLPTIQKINPRNETNT